MRNFFKQFVRDERGVSAMEYAIMAGIVAVALLAVGSAFNTSITTLFTNMEAKVTSASSTS